MKNTFFQVGLNRINKPLQKSIFKAVFWVYTRALDPGASGGHQEDGLVDHLNDYNILFKNVTTPNSLAAQNFSSAYVLRKVFA